jgi:hypothetical protein
VKLSSQTTLLLKAVGVTSSAILRQIAAAGRRPCGSRAWQTACAFDDQSSCPRTSPHRLTLAEVRAIGNMVSSPESRASVAPGCTGYQRVDRASSGGVLEFAHERNRTAEGIQ